MSKQNHRVEQPAERKKPEVKPVAVEPQATNGEMIPGPEVLLSRGSLENQADLLQRLNTVQRQEMVQRISHSQGNRHVLRVVDVVNQSTAKGASSSHSSTPPIQAKLSVSQPGDPYEVEADQMADKVMRMPPALATPPPDDGGGSGGDGKPNGAVQRAVSQLQAREDGGLQTSDAVESRIQQMRGGGSPMPDGERDFFESRMGVDLSNVRLHTGSNAVQLSQDLQARAFTVGSDVMFNQGEYTPGAEGSRRLLAHELTHVIQQGGAGELRTKRKSQANRCMDERCRAEGAMLKSEAQRSVDGEASTTPLVQREIQVNRCMNERCRASAQLMKSSQLSRLEEGLAQRAPLSLPEPTVAYRVQREAKVNRCMNERCRADAPLMKPALKHSVARSVIQLKAEEPLSEKANRCGGPDCRATEGLLKQTMPRTTPNPAAGMMDRIGAMVRGGAAPVMDSRFRQDGSAAISFRPELPTSKGEGTKGNGKGNGNGNGNGKTEGSTGTGGGRAQSKGKAAAEAEADGPSAGKDPASKEKAQSLDEAAPKANSKDGGIKDLLSTSASAVSALTSGESPDSLASTGPMGDAVTELSSQLKAAAGPALGDVPAKADAVAEEPQPKAAAPEAAPAIEKLGNEGAKLNQAWQDRTSEARTNAGLPDLKSLPLSAAWSAVKQHTIKVETEAQGKAEAHKGDPDKAPQEQKAAEAAALQQEQKAVEKSSQQEVKAGTVAAQDVAAAGPEPEGIKALTEAATPAAEPAVPQGEIPAEEAGPAEAPASEDAAPQAVEAEKVAAEAGQPEKQAVGDAAPKAGPAEKDPKTAEAETEQKDKAAEAEAAQKEKAAEAAAPETESEPQVAEPAAAAPEAALPGGEAAPQETPTAKAAVPAEKEQKGAASPEAGSAEKEPEAGLKIQRVPLQVQRGVLDSLIPGWAKSLLSSLRGDASAKKGELKGEGGARSGTARSDSQSKGQEVDGAGKTKGSELQADQQAKGAELQSDKQAKGTELQSGQQAKGTELQSGQQTKSAELQSSQQAKGAELQSDKQAKSAELQSSQQSKGAELQSDSQKKGQELQSDSQAKGQEMDADLKSKGTELQADQQAKGAELQADSQAKAQELQGQWTQAQDSAKQTESNVTKQVDTAATALQTAASAANAQVESGWSQLQNEAQTTVQNLDSQANQLCSLYQGKADEFMSKFDPMIQNAQKGWQEIKDGAAAAWDGFMKTAQPALDAIGKKWQQFTAWAGPNVWEPLKKKAGEFAAKAGQLASQAWTSAKQLWTNLTQGWTSAEQWIQGKADAARNWITGKADAARNWINGKADAARNWINGKVQAAQAFISGKANAARDWISGKADAARAFISGKADSARAFISGKADAARSWINSTGNAARNWMTGKADAARNWITGRATAASNWINGKVSAAQSWIQGKATAVTNWFRNMGQGLVSGMASKARGAANAISSRGGAIGKWFGGVLNGLISGVEGAGNSAVNAVSNAMNSGLSFVESKASAAIGFVGRVGNGAIQGISNLGTGAVNFVQQAGTGAVNFVQQTATNAVNTVERVGTGAVNFVEQTATGAVNVVEKAGTGAVTFVENAANGAVSFVGNAATGAVNAVQGAATRVVNGAEQMGRNAVTFVEGKAQGAVQGLKDAWSAIQAGWNSFTNWLGPALQWVGEKASWLGNEINTNIIQPASQWIQQQWTGLQNYISEKFPGLVACWNTFKEFAGAAWEKFQELPLVKDTIKAVGEIIEGAIMGDFLENPSIWNIIGQVVVGFIPYAGQVADIRDLIAAIKKVAEGKDGAWLDLSLALVGVIPGIGDAIKAGKHLDKVDEVVDAATAITKNLDEAVQASDEILAPVIKHGDEGIEAVSDAVTKYGDDALDAIAEHGDEAVEAIVKNGDEGLSAVKHTDEVADAGKHTDEVVDAGKHTDEVADAGKHTDEAADAGKHTDEAADAGKHTDEAADAGKHTDEAADAGKHTDEAADAGKHTDEAADAGKKTDEAVDASKEADEALETGVVDKVTTPSGHEIKFTESGMIVRCSYCEIVGKYGDQLSDAGKQALQRFDEDAIRIFNDLGPDEGARALEILGNSFDDLGHFEFALNNLVKNGPISLDDFDQLVKQFPNGDELFETLSVFVDKQTKAVLGSDFVESMRYFRGDVENFKSLVNDFADAGNANRMLTALRSFGGNTNELINALDALKRGGFGTYGTTFLPYLKNSADANAITALTKRLGDDGLRSLRPDMLQVVAAKSKSELPDELQPLFQSLSDFKRGFNDVEATDMADVIKKSFGAPTLADDSALRAMEASNKMSVTTIGSLENTLPAGADGGRALVIPEWTMELNHQFMQDVIDKRQVFRIGTTIDDASLLRLGDSYKVSVYLRELEMVKNAGYVRVGDYLVPPEMVKGLSSAGGAGTTALKGVDDLADAGKHLDDAADAGKHVDDAADAGKTTDAAADAGKKAEELTDPGKLADELDDPTVVPGKAGSPEHKAARWAEYQARGGEWSYERWSKVYDINMEKARRANAAVDSYHAELSWGKREVTIDVDGEPRRLDIADVKRQRGIEYKTGYQCASQEILSEAARDAKLVAKKWQITWVFEGTASAPLLEKLKEYGIKVEFRK